MVQLGQYISRASIVHKLDPRVKLASAVLLSIMILRGDLLTQCWMTVFLLIVVCLSHLSYFHIVSAVRPVRFFLGLLFFLHLLFTKGTPIPPFPNWPVTVTHEGLYTAAFVVWQFCLLILSASILTMSTPPGDLISGIEKLLRPLKILGVPSHDLALMISMALRFVPTILEELNHIRDAQTARGACFASGPLAKRITAAASLLLPLILATIRRADTLTVAMESRAYRRGPRTYLRELRMNQKDYLALGLLAGILGLDPGLHFLLSNAPQKLQVLLAK